MIHCWGWTNNRELITREAAVEFVRILNASNLRVEPPFNYDLPLKEEEHYNARQSLVMRGGSWKNYVPGMRHAQRTPEQLRFLELAVRPVDGMQNRQEDQALWDMHVQARTDQRKEEIQLTDYQYKIINDDNRTIYKEEFLSRPCTICFEQGLKTLRDVNSQGLAIFDCQHFMCVSCAKDYIKYNNTCPECRRKITKK